MGSTAAAHTVRGKEDMRRKILIFKQYTAIVRDFLDINTDFG